MLAAHLMHIVAEFLLPLDLFRNRSLCSADKCKRERYIVQFRDNRNYILLTIANRGRDQCTLRWLLLVLTELNWL
jgi:hypothetical protein